MDGRINRKTKVRLFKSPVRVSKSARTETAILKENNWRLLHMSIAVIIVVAVVVVMLLLSLLVLVYVL